MREAKHSSPTNAEVNKLWIYISTPHIRLHGLVLNQLSTGTTLPLTTSDNIDKIKRIQTYTVLTCDVKNICKL
jgi:hypothetical protein